MTRHERLAAALRRTRDEHDELFCLLRLLVVLPNDENAMVAAISKLGDAADSNTAALEILCEQPEGEVTHAE